MNMMPFKKFVDAKKQVESGKVDKTMNKNYFIRKILENEEILEDDQASTRGGEIDALMATTAGAMLLFTLETKKVLTFIAGYKNKKEAEWKAKEKQEITDAQMGAQADLLKKQFSDNYDKQVSQKAENMPREKRADFRQLMTDQKDDKVKGYGAKIDARVTAAKEGTKAKVTAATKKLTDFEGKNKPSLPVLQAQQSERKSEIDLELSQKYTVQIAEKKAQALGQGEEDDAAIQKKLQVAKELAAKDAQERKAALAKKEERLKEEEAAWQERLDKAGEKEKEAIEKMKAYSTSMQEFKAAVDEYVALVGESIDLSNMDSIEEMIEWINSPINEEGEQDAQKLDDAKKKATEAGKKLNKALKSITPGLLKKAMKFDDSEAQKYIQELEAEKEALMTELHPDATKFDVEDDTPSELDNKKKEGWSDQEPADFGENPGNYEKGTAKDDNDKPVTIWKKIEDKNPEESELEKAKKEGYNEGEPSEEQKNDPKYTEKTVKNDKKEDVKVWMIKKDDEGGQQKTPTEKTPEEKQKIQDNIDRYTQKLNDPKMSDATKQKIRDKIAKWEKELEESAASYYDIMKEMDELDKEISASSGPTSRFVSFSDFISSKRK